MCSVTSTAHSSLYCFLFPPLSCCEIDHPFDVLQFFTNLDNAGQSTFQTTSLPVHPTRRSESGQQGRNIPDTGN
ncbi:hypothetical protein BU24DRAFT_426381, partial [Aaosphaeria arxii CBS 175.79]